MRKLPGRLPLLLAAGAIALAAFSFAGPAAAARTEGRALWVVRSSLVSAAGVDSAIARALQVHATDLFVQVRGRGDAFYPSALVPRAEAARDTAFDGFAYALARGHARGFAVHAWVNVYLLWSADHRPPSPQHVLNAHPEWMEIDRTGRSLAYMTPAQHARLGAEGAWAAPSDSGYRAHFVDVVREILARYAVDGVHLDYVRYPSLAVGYTPAMRDGFTRAHGVDPLALGRRDWTLRRAWQAYRADQVTALVRAVRAAVDSTRPGTLLSAAVIPEPDDAHARCGQDWPRWLADSLLDFAAPMCYATRRSTVVRQIRLSQAAAAGRPIYAGIAVYNQRAASASEKLALARSLGVAGLALFSYNAIAPDDAYWSRLVRDVFGDAPAAPAWPRHASLAPAQRPAVPGSP